MSLISITIIFIKLIKFNGVLSGKKRIEAALAQVQQRQNDMAMQELDDRVSRYVAAYTTARQSTEEPEKSLEPEPGTGPQSMGELAQQHRVIIHE